MKYIYTFFLFIAFLHSYSQSDSEIKKPEYKRASQAFGFLLGQEFTLNRIKANFPQYSLQLKKAEIEFNSNFGFAKSNITSYLKEFYNDKFGEFEVLLRKELEKTLSSQQIDESNAVGFIAEVEGRARGKIPSPVLETLLSFQFQDSPEQEFLTGSTRTFRTKGHLKAKNTDWQVDIPKSWYAKEGNRPNIIQTFTSECGDGLEMVSLMVKDLPLPKGYKPSQKELADFFSEKSMRQMVPARARYISSKRVTLDNHIGGMLEIEQSIERVDMTAKVRMLQFSFYSQSKMYVLQCSVAGSTQQDLGPRLRKFLPLFKLIANSVTVNDQYR